MATQVTQQMQCSTLMLQLASSSSSSQSSSCLKLLKAFQLPFRRLGDSYRVPRPFSRTKFSSRNAITAASIQEESRKLLPIAETGKKLSFGLVACSSLFLQAGGAVSASEELTRFSPAEWVDIYITSGVSFVLYFFIIPLVIYNYLRLRWYKRNMPETYFQFMLVFIFFPGMLLLAPFINFRRLPKDGADAP
jgi:hypothetical protein